MSPLQVVEQGHLCDARVRGLGRLQSRVLLIELADGAGVVHVAQLGQQRLQVHRFRLARFRRAVDGREARAHFGTGLHDAIQRLVDIGIALPGLIFIILVVTSMTQFPPDFIADPLGLEPSGRVVFRIAISLGILVALGSSRVIRGAASSAKQNTYVEAARVVGATDGRIMWKHIFPNVFAVVLVSASIQIGGAILTESSLAFLGYGVQPPTPSWGRMLNEAREYLVRYPHLAIFPGAAIFVTVIAANLVGDGLRDALDPKNEGRPA